MSTMYRAARLAMRLEEHPELKKFISVEFAKKEETEKETDKEED